MKRPLPKKRSKSAANHLLWKGVGRETACMEMANVIGTIPVRSDAYILLLREYEYEYEYGTVMYCSNTTRLATRRACCHIRPTVLPSTAYCLPRAPDVLACALYTASSAVLPIYILLPIRLMPTGNLLTMATAYCLLPTAYCLLPTAYCLLPTAYCLSTAYCLLPAACCLLPTDYHLLPTAYCLPADDATAYTAVLPTVLPTAYICCLPPTTYTTRCYLQYCSTSAKKSTKPAERTPAPALTQQCLEGCPRRV